ncbi:MAG: hypothetical protein IJY90_01005 [Clostridia bacterium]|nr:hypothetical protein [Clostridia bacterium]
MKENVKDFLDACDELLNCKYLVAEYKIQRTLKALANSDEICSLLTECLEQFNRDREFAKAYIQDGHGDFVYISPSEEYKVIALVFCTLVDIDNKKIDLVDFIKRFFGREENPFQAFLTEMILPFRNLIAEVFGGKQYAAGVPEAADAQEGAPEEEETEEEVPNYEGDENVQDDEEGEEDDFKLAQKIAVQILSQLEFSKQDETTENVMQICRAIVKTAVLQDEDVMFGLVYALKHCKEKQVKYLIKELVELFY